ncbi:MAG: KEOPS complex kinase/ATPase Bud32 [archaeon]|jgi:Kae1-associated kinase Bud32
MNKEINKGAEAKILESFAFGKKLIIKQRVSKDYRDPVLDKRIIKTRNKQEATLLKKAKVNGINTPDVFYVGLDKIIMEKLENTNNHKKQLEAIGKEIAKLHELGIIHGDLNLINIITTKDKKIYFIDFGLGYLSNKIEDKATDLLVFKKTLFARKTTEGFWKGIEAGYQKQSKDKAIIEQIKEIEKRARYL